jgi:predicted acetylornithine/succinylornithine family transaminase
MGALLDNARRLDAAFHIGTYGRKGVLFVQGSGMVLVDDDGREYLDFVSGLGVVNLGHSHPSVVEAVRRQVGRLTHVSNLYHVEHQGAFAKAVCEMVGPAREAFLCNSGTEATEGAVKFARKWGRERKGPGCTTVVTALRSFHGRTLAALAATGQPAKHEPFAPMPEGFVHVPLNDIAALEQVVGDETCAVMLETIQGEGGVHPCTTEYLRAVSELCREQDVLLIVDEVQTGCWRTGPALAHQAHGIEADIVTLAKALANGLPVGAVVARQEIADVLSPGDHGSTFGGGPVVCAAGVATLDALRDEGLGEQARRIGHHLHDRLREMMHAGAPIAEVRGAGLMVGVQLEGVDAGAVADRALGSGILVNNIGSDIVRFLPPLVCTEEHVDRALAVIGECLQNPAPTAAGA